MKRERITLLLGILFVLVLTSAVCRAADSPEHFVYVAPNVIQARALNVFTTFALTNTTEYWFNPRIFLVSPEGEIVYRFSPLLKGFGTWQKASIDLLTDDFKGSVWIVSPQPLVSLALIHQLDEAGCLRLIGNVKLERIGSSSAQVLPDSE